VLARRQLLVPVLQFEPPLLVSATRRSPGTRLVVAPNAVRFQLHALADNLANVRRTLALPEKVERGSLTLLRATAVKIGAAKDSGYPDRTTGAINGERR
jgi:hypothetical protein